jgi:hypothetical protein
MAMVATCKLGTNGCWNDGKCRATSNCTEKVITNGDRIRAMSDEKLADFIAETIITHIDEALDILYVPHKVTKGSKEKAEAECLGWLQQPVEE